MSNPKHHASQSRAAVAADAPAAFRLAVAVLAITTLVAVAATAVARAEVAASVSPTALTGPFDRTETFRGTAWNEDGGMAYTESHELRYADETLVAARTEYRDPAGELIASLESDYSRSAFLPDYEFRDFRSDKVEGLRWDGDEMVAYRRQAGDAELDEKRLPVRDDSVGGQGFNNWVIDKLDELDEGEEESVTFHFAVPDRLRDVKLTLKRTDALAPDGVLQLKCELSNWFLRLLAPSIQLAYDVERGRLLEYRGNSNLASDSGDVMQVRIVYEYDDMGDDRFVGETRVPDDV